MVTSDRVARYNFLRNLLGVRRNHPRANPHAAVRRPGRDTLGDLRDGHFYPTVTDQAWGCRWCRTPQHRSRI